jgi:hypothetical protein
MSTGDGYEHLLPDERLIARQRNDQPASGLAAASTLREAAADLVREGYLLHYQASRYYAIEDRDLALLAGDRMYAAGLAVLAAADDVEAVGVLARLIAACAEAHAAGDEAAADRIWADSLAMLAPDSTGM